MPFRMPNIFDAIELSIWHQDCYWSNHKPMAFLILLLMFGHINDALHVHGKSVFVWLAIISLKKQVVFQRSA